MKRIQLFLTAVAITLAMNVPEVSAQSDEAVFWQSISSSKDASEYCAYLEAYPKGKFATLAKLRVAKLKGTCGGAPAPTQASPSAPSPAPTKPVPSAQSQPVAPPQRTGVGRYWSYVPMNDDDLYVGRIVYNSEYFQGAPVAEIGVTRGNDTRLVWFFQDSQDSDFGAGTGEYEINVFLSDYDEQEHTMSLDSILMLRDKEKGCDFKNVSFCTIKCGKAQNEFSYRGAEDCKTISSPWYEFKAEMAERHWKNLLSPPIYRSRIWIQPGGNNYFLSTEGLVETICDHVKGADQYCTDEVRRVAATASGSTASAPAAAAIDIDPMNELRYTRSASNVRSAPGTYGDKLLTLQEGQQVEVTGKVSGENWYRIKLAGGSDGYIFGNLLTTEKPGGAGASAPVASASPAPARTTSNSSDSLPAISEANGPLCEFYGEGKSWKMSAGFDRVSVSSTDALESFSVHNGFDANGIELGFTEYPDAGGAKEVDIDIFNVKKNGEIIYDRLEGEYTKHKYIDGALTLSAGGETTSVSGSSHVFEFLAGGSSIGFDLPGNWMIEKLRAGHDIEIELSMQGSLAVTMIINTETFIDAFRHTTRAQSKMADNLANGRCGFCAGTPSASSVVLGCTLARDRAPGNVEGVRFAVIPGAQLENIKNAVKDDPRKIEIFDASMPVYEIVDNLGGFFEGVTFYDRDVRKRAHPIDGSPLVIGEMINLPLFKQLAEQAGGGEFRCELLVAAEVCPHPKTSQASQPCN